MKAIFQKLFNKSEDENFVLNKNAEYRFVLKYREISISELYTKDGFWYFKYTEEFKQNSDKLYGIFGFDDLFKISRINYCTHIYPL